MGATGPPKVDPWGVHSDARGFTDCLNCRDGTIRVRRLPVARMVAPPYPTTTTTTTGSHGTPPRTRRRRPGDGRPRGGRGGHRHDDDRRSKNMEGRGPRRRRGRAREAVSKIATGRDGRWPCAGKVPPFESGKHITQLVMQKVGRP